ncbi:MAG: ATP-binding protein [Candidatus Omnitrophica bacterium]|nr:ATP-binding protein [Candidatus Omnitrophota bacterium]
MMKANYYIPRDIEASLKDIVNSFPATAVTGPRQSGKSTMLGRIFKNSHNMVSFDDPLVREQAIKDPRLFIENCGEKIIFDEIQYVPEILSYLKILIDKDRHKRGRFILTGSQQFNLIRNLGESLAGRIGLLELLSFSILEKKKIGFFKKDFIDTKTYYVHSCLRGSFPEITLYPDIKTRHWYAGYIQTYLERDIRTIYNIGQLREFQQFLHLLSVRCAQILNLSSFANDLGVSVNTIKKWLAILEASRIIYILPPYHRNLGKRIIKSPKIYFLDNALICYLTNTCNKDDLFRGPLAGALFENFVVQETVKHFFNKGIQPRLFYLRTHNNTEVDLLIERGVEVFPVEIKLTKTPSLIMARPIEKFRSNFKKLRINEGCVVALSSNNFKLSSNVSVFDMDSYLKYLDDILSALGVPQVLAD